MRSESVIHGLNAHTRSESFVDGSNAHMRSESARKRFERTHAQRGHQAHSMNRSARTHTRSETTRQRCERTHAQRERQAHSMNRSARTCAARAPGNDLNAQLCVCLFVRDIHAALLCLALPCLAPSAPAVTSFALLCSHPPTPSSTHPPLHPLNPGSS